MPKVVSCQMEGKDAIKVEAITPFFRSVLYPDSVLFFIISFCFFYTTVVPLFSAFHYVL